MNLEIKRLLNNVLLNCEENIREQIIKDIFDFIKIISDKNGENRISYFKEIYLSEEYRSIKENDIVEERPKSITYFVHNSLNMLNAYIAIYYALGKEFCLNRYHKNDINQDKLNKYIQYLNDVKEKQYKITKCVKTETSFKKEHEENEELTLEQLQLQLNEMIGLQGVKLEVSTLVNVIKINNIRKSRGLKTTNTTNHLVFTGNPGTGKTTVARVLAQIYKRLGVLEKGQLIEVDRGDLVAGYIGQTALKTKEKIEEAMGGILFIDEAYTLVKGENDFGQEAIDTLLKAMEDYRDSFMVIVAGYPNEMEQFLESNPGLRSRFNKIIRFEDYTEKELYLIFDSICQTNGYEMSDEAKKIFKNHLKIICKNRPANFANGREMRNIFNATRDKQANRLANFEVLTDEQLIEFIPEDFPF